MKYIKLFEEYMNKLGAGLEHEVYEIDDDFVLKSPHREYDDDYIKDFKPSVSFLKEYPETFADFKHHINFMKKYPEIFVNVKQLDKFRASIERVNTKQAKEELKYIREVMLKIQAITDDIHESEDTSAIMLYYDKVISCLKKYLFKNKDKIVEKWLNFCELLNKTIPDLSFDIHDGQFGIDKNGKIKLLDF